MPGPAPSADRQNRPGRDLAWTDLPASGRPGRAPALPKGVTLDAAGKAWWADAWKTPSATQWADAAKARLVARRARVEDALADELSVGLLAVARHLEHMLGLTPKSRKELRWRVVASDGAVVEQAGVTDVPDELELRRRQAISGRQTG